MAAGDSPGSTLYPASSSNYSVASRPASNSINKIIVHVTQGSWAGAINWFQDPNAQVSAHYTVHSSDGKRARGRLSRQGSPLLRWALFEAAQCAARPSSPDHAYYRQVADRLGGNRAALSVARKIARRAHHTLRALGDEAFASV